MEVPLAVVDRIVDDEVEDLEPVEIQVSGERLYRFDPSRGPLFDTAWNGWIIHVAREYDVDAALISAVIKAESDYDPRVISHKGAIGLMQLMPATATRFGVSDPHDPIQNLRGGVQYLSWLIDRFDGSIDLVLAGYNAGEGNVRKYEGVPPFRETRNYIRKISGYLGG
ncbi:MAG: lytic transglycosylase domain-containing protein [Acidobacteria bacterium]|nr:lytic transglycosylase domain-containing protein [Acidobacteriota bacterium]